MTPTGDCDLHITIRQTQTLYNWLWRLRCDGRGPTPAQRQWRRGRNRAGRASPFRRALQLRADYVRFMAEVFLESTLRG